MVTSPGEMHANILSVLTLPGRFSKISFPSRVLALSYSYGHSAHIPIHRTESDKQQMRVEWFVLSTRPTCSLQKKTDYAWTQGIRRRASLPVQHGQSKLGLPYTELPSSAKSPTAPLKSWDSMLQSLMPPNTPGCASHDD